MKKALLFLLIPFFLSSCEKTEVLTINEVPSEITSYVNTHFADIPILQVIKDTEGIELEYHVTLKDGYSLEFNRKKEVKHIQGISKLPDSVIPEKLRLFVTENYTNSHITGWELDDINQNIKLNSGLELEFTMKGEFLRIDN